jgi:hypothetical protein
LKKKTSLLISIILFSTILFAQKNKSSKMGQTTLEELEMTVYAKDSSASAVVLYEHTNRYPDKLNDETPRTDYYYRIKILNKDSFSLANIEINLYQKQKIKNIRAISYNQKKNGTIEETTLLEKDIFTIKKDQNWRSKKFTLPNIKEGTVIEYKYSILSPYLSVDDWCFQSDIPKIKSKFDAAILGNYTYHIKLVGPLKLNFNEVTVDKKCIFIEGIGSGACIIYNYSMNDIPAFKEENYMLSKKNYISRLTFDLKSSTSYRGVVQNLTTTWEQADESLKKQFFNNQTSKKKYFKKNIPDGILNTENNLIRAKQVYSFIQNHYSWNNKNWTNEDAKVKKAFKEKTGNVGEINISLYNSLKAANIDANLLVLSTRDNGMPTKLFPIIYDYNYVIVKATIDTKEYYLDATDKFLPFGQVPERALNGEARVISFKEDGEWTALIPYKKSEKTTRLNLKLSKEGSFSGTLHIRRTGYSASNKRKEIASMTEENYLSEFESEYPDIEIEEYLLQFEKEIEKSIQERFNITIFKSDQLKNKVRINPFFFDRIKENPFKLKERTYPVDFAYPRKSNYYLSLEIPENYEITQLPKDIAIALPNNGGRFVLQMSKKNNSIILILRFSIQKRTYSSEEYFALKEYFKQIVTAENADIVLEKKM